MNRKIIFSVDDTATMLAIIEEALCKNYNVISLDSAEKMFVHLKRIKPDLILLDYYMPGMTCHEAMGRLKGDEQYASIPVVVMSASNYPEIIDEIEAMGAKDFICKPFGTNEQLEEMVEKWTA